MGSLNKVVLIGNLGQEPERRITQGGASLVNVNMATSEFYKDKSGNNQQKTEWHRLVFWNKQADLVSQYCKKGSTLFIEGRLETNEWKDKDGNKRETVQVVVNTMQFLDSKGK